MSGITADNSFLEALASWNQVLPDTDTQPTQPQQVLQVNSTNFQWAVNPAPTTQHQVVQFHGCQAPRLAARPTHQHSATAAQWKQAQLTNLEKQPLFTDLQAALKKDCTTTRTPTTLADLMNDSTNAPVPVPLTVKISTLQLRFTLLGSKFRASVDELQGMYRMKSADLERGRYGTLLQTQPWTHDAVNHSFDQQHLALIARIEASLSLLEKKQQQQQQPQKQVHRNTQHRRDKLQQLAPEGNPPSKDNPKNAPQRTPINPLATRIMETWYSHNEEHAYPGYETCELMAKTGDITVEQVKKWFANRRRRRSNTKPLSQIANRRKRCREETTEDLLQLGSKRLRQ